MATDKHNKFKAKKSSSYKRQVNNVELRANRKEPFIVFSFKNFDQNQGQSFEDWEKDELLALAMNRLKSISNLTVSEATTQNIIKQYTKVDFPPHSHFYHPKHIPNDVVWCSMHIQGKECIIGYFEENVFYIVFLDKDHQFWLSSKKNT